MVPATDRGRTLFPLWFSNVFLMFRSSCSVRVLGADRRSRSCAASRGPMPSWWVVPWDGTPLHAPGMGRGARIRSREADFPLVLKVFEKTAGLFKNTAIHMLFVRFLLTW